ncbi:MAG TPA: hypothetical protein VJK04_04540 [Candidatus Paceibacterota bacterium]
MTLGERVEFIRGACDAAKGRSGRDPFHKLDFEVLAKYAGDTNLGPELSQKEIALAIRMAIREKMVGCGKLDSGGVSRSLILTEHILFAFYCAKKEKDIFGHIS